LRRSDLSGDRAPQPSSRAASPLLKLPFPGYRVYIALRRSSELHLRRSDSSRDRPPQRQAEPCRRRSKSRFRGTPFPGYRPCPALPLR
jgi:hypothetical protein